MVAYETASRFSPGSINKRLATTHAERYPPFAHRHLENRPRSGRRHGRMVRPARGDQGRHRGDGQGRIEVSAFSPAAIGPGGALLAIFLSFVGSAYKVHVNLVDKGGLAVRFQLSLTSIVIPKGTGQVGHCIHRTRPPAP